MFIKSEKIFYFPQIKNVLDDIICVHVCVFLCKFSDFIDTLWNFVWKSWNQSSSQVLIWSTNFFRILHLNFQFQWYLMREKHFFTSVSHKCPGWYPETRYFICFAIRNGNCYLFHTLKNLEETEDFFGGCIFIMADFIPPREVLGIFARIFSQYTGPDAQKCHRLSAAFLA